jgi:hypothetical protein
MSIVIRGCPCWNRMKFFREVRLAAPFFSRKLSI